MFYYDVFLPPFNRILYLVSTTASHTHSNSFIFCSDSRTECTTRRSHATPKPSEATPAYHHYNPIIPPRENTFPTTLRINHNNHSTNRHHHRRHRKSSRLSNNNSNVVYCVGWCLFVKLLHVIFVTHGKKVMTCDSVCSNAIHFGNHDPNLSFHFHFVFPKHTHRTATSTGLHAINSSPLPAHNTTAKSHAKDATHSRHLTTSPTSNAKM